ncbi:alanine--tRNA ligase, mitochondrial-like [Ciona intestinalis]
MLLTRFGYRLNKSHFPCTVLTSKLHNYSSKELRDIFIKFFERRDHEFIPSSKVYTPEDPSLLFVNAGMNQFKPVLLGDQKRKSLFSNVKRAVNSQKCIRAGGKHNDLNDVGHDLTHHTFFEMLGSWSFGDYFKEEACKMAWLLLTEVLNLSPDRLYVTYFNGCPLTNLKPDYDTREIWKSIGVAHNRILPFGSTDNFWEMGETGPCGPCTEIHYDRIGNRHVPEQVNKSLSDVVEIWNIVFMQFNKVSLSQLEPLDVCHVDSGMGLERITAVMQQKQSNYDTDLFVPILSAIEEISKVGPYKGRVGEEDTNGIDAAYRMISDHIRMLTVAISDGIYPGPKGRELILRKVLRRAVLAGIEKLQTPRPFLYTLLPTVVESLSCAFPEVELKQDEVMEVIRESEMAFYRTLDRGDLIVRKTMKNLVGNDFPPEVAHKLRLQNGYPLKRMLPFLRQEKLNLNMMAVDSFQKQLSEKNLSKKSFNFLDNEEDRSSLVHSFSKQKFEPTVCVNSAQQLSDHQYTFASVSAKLCRVVNNEGVMHTELNLLKRNVENLFLLLDKTNLSQPFHGKFSNIGSIYLNGRAFPVVNVINLEGWFLHEITTTDLNVDYIQLCSGDLVTVEQNEEYELTLIRTHSAKQKLKATCVKILPNHAILKLKVSLDQLSIELAGNVEEELIGQLENHFKTEIINDRQTLDHGVRYTPCVINFVITKCRRQGKAKTILTCVVGEKASNALDLCSQIESGVEILKSECENIHEHTSAEVLIKKIGDATFTLNNSEIPYQRKNSMREILRKLSGRMNTMQKKRKKESTL